MTLDKQAMEQGLISEHSIHNWFAFASDIGIRAGQWPEKLETTLGNKMPFIRTSKRVKEGDLLSVVYYQGNGCLRLEIFNT